MECCTERKESRNNGDNMANKSSDFSIDHILNRAGSNCNKSDNVFEGFQFCAGHNDDRIKVDSNIVPMFDWLQYTRYRPPKLPRPVRTAPVKRTPGRLPRVPFSPMQLAALEKAYKSSKYLSSEEANKLADQLYLTNTRVKIWFQNRRARERREKREIEDCSISSSPHSESDISFSKDIKYD